MYNKKHKKLLNGELIFALQQQINSFTAAPFDIHIMYRDLFNMFLLITMNWV